MSGDGTVTTTGTGQAKVVPDTLRLQLAAEATEADVATALASATVALDALRGSLLAGGVPPEVLQTGEMWLGRGHDERGRPRGYGARLGLQVRLTDLHAAGRLLAAALAAAGDAARLDHAELESSDVAPALHDARVAAFTDARAKAEHYADLAGRSLGPALTVEEDVSGGAVPVARHRRSAEAMVAAMPVDPGTTALSTRVTVRWQLL